MAAVALLAIAAGCTGTSAAPPVVRPTIAGIEALGFRCGEGAKDGVPSGLFQWSCRGAVEDVQSTVLVDGNEEGVAGITLIVDGSKDPEVARTAYLQLVDGVPPISTAPILADAVAGWTGEQRTRAVGGVRVSASCDATQCVVTVMPAGDALRPLPLP